MSRAIDIDNDADSAIGDDLYTPHLPLSYFLMRY